MTDALILEKLNVIIKLLESQLVVSDKLFKLMNQYNADYINEIEGDGIVPFSSNETENYKPKKLKKINNL